MSKTYKGYELYKMIAEGKIKEGTKFKDNREIIWRWNGVDFVCIQQGRYQDVVFAKMDFELIENEIDIQNMPKLGKIFFMRKDINCLKEQINAIIDNHNKLLEAVKQIDRKSGGK